MVVLKKALLVAGSLLVLLLCLLVGPLDYFAHGFSSSHAAIGDIGEDGLGETVGIDADEVFVCGFTPARRHFAGFEVYLANEPELQGGELAFIVRDSGGEAVAIASVDLSLDALTSWCHPVLDSQLSVGEDYTLYASASGCPVAPELRRVDSGYLGAGITEGDVLLGLAYREPDFSLADKAFLVTVLACAWLAVCVVALKSARRRGLAAALVSVCMGALLCWNYSTSILDNGNDSFTDFQQTSESLVSSCMESATVGKVESVSPYGLGWIQDVTGKRTSWRKTALVTDDEWASGFSRSKPEILVDDNDYTRSVMAVGNKVRFLNDAEYRIVGTADGSKGLVVKLDGSGTLKDSGLGGIEDAVILDSNSNEMASGAWIPYESQFGLQGKLFERLASLIGDYSRSINVAHLLCAALLALVLMGVVLLVRKKHGALMAGCFYVVFLLSPWIVNFANNLYWVPFTWFLPMLVGLFCAIKVRDRRCRVASYVLMFLAVAVKCLCGYEYITSIMIAAVAFCVADAAKAAAEGDREGLAASAKAAAGLGCAALLGFFAAVLLHAGMRGGGDIVTGVIDIFQKDVLRRTSGGGLDAFDSVFWPSLNSSHWEVLLKYFSFPTEVVTGVAGNLFPALCLAPLAVFAFDARIRQIDWGAVALYVVFFAAAASWFVLAKSHSYVHVHMNYVLWSFGFIQVCLYVLIDKGKRYIESNADGKANAKANVIGSIGLVN